MTSTPAAAVPDRSPIILRQGTAGDRAYVLRTWADSYIESPLYDDLWPPGAPPRGSLYAALCARAERLLDAGQLIVAAFDEQPAYILGWTVFRKHGGLIDYVYVRSEHRHGGIARTLLGAAGVRPGHPVLATHWTAMCARKRMVFVPDYPKPGRAS